MIFKRKHFALQTGYDANFDASAVTVAIGKRKGAQSGLLQWKFMLGVSLSKPQLIWYDKHWHTNEPGYLAALPVARQKPKKWLLRGIIFPWMLNFNGRHYGGFYIGAKCQLPRMPDWMTDD